MLLIPESVCKVNHLIRTLKFYIAFNLDANEVLEKFLSFAIESTSICTCD